MKKKKLFFIALTILYMFSAWFNLSVAKHFPEKSGWYFFLLGSLFFIAWAIFVGLFIGALEKKNAWSLFRLLLVAGIAIISISLFCNSLHKGLFFRPFLLSFLLTTIYFASSDKKKILNKKRASS